MAGPAGGFDAKAGDTVTLGSDRGPDPWGSNLVYSWSKASGTTVDPSATDVAQPTVTAPALAEAAALEYGLTVTARGHEPDRDGQRDGSRVAAAALVSSVAPVSEPVSGDTYKRGEMIEIAVTFSMPVTVTGAPQLALSVGTNTRQAAFYVPRLGDQPAGVRIHRGNRPYGHGRHRHRGGQSDTRGRHDPGRRWRGGLA